MSNNLWASCKPSSGSTNPGLLSRAALDPAQIQNSDFAVEALNSSPDLPFPTSRVVMDNDSQEQPSERSDILFNHQFDSIEKIQTDFRFLPNNLARPQPGARRFDASKIEDQQMDTGTSISVPVLVAPAASKLIKTGQSHRPSHLLSMKLPAVQPSFDFRQRIHSTTTKGNSGHIDSFETIVALLPENIDSADKDVIEQDKMPSRGVGPVGYHEYELIDQYDNDGQDDTSSTTIDEVDLVRNKFEIEARQHKGRESLYRNQSVLNDTDCYSIGSHEASLELSSTQQPNKSIVIKEIIDMPSQSVEKEITASTTVDDMKKKILQHMSDPSQGVAKLPVQRCFKGGLDTLQHKSTERHPQSVRNRQDDYYFQTKGDQQAIHLEVNVQKTQPRIGHVKEQSFRINDGVDLALTPSPKQDCHERPGEKDELVRKTQKHPSRSATTNCTNTSSERPVSRTSNIAKRRNFVQLTRMTAPSPLDPLKEHVQEDQKNLALCWNGYFSREKEYLGKLEAKVKRLEGFIQEYEHTIEQFGAREEAQSQSIQDLEEKSNRLQALVDVERNNFSKQDSKIRELRTKCHEYKERLNQALKEQQQLYTKSKQNVKSIICELQLEHKASEKSREDSLKAIADKSESIRQTLQKDMNEIAAEARQKNAELANTIHDLKKDLEERKQEIKREKHSNEKVRSELEASRRVNTDSLSTLQAQNTKILEALEKQRNQSQTAMLTVDKYDEKLNSLAKNMEELKSQALDPGIITENLAASREEVTKSVVAEIHNLESWMIHTDSKQKDRSHEKAVEEIVVLCHTIEQHLRGENGMLNWQKRCQKADEKLLVTAEKQKSLQDEVDYTTNAYQEILSKYEELKGYASSLEQQAVNLQAEVKAGEKLQVEETDMLKQLIVEKDATARDLQAKLEASQSNGRKTQQAIDSAAQIQKQHNAEKAKEIEQLREKCQDTERRVTSADKARAQLEQSLQEAREKIQRLSTNRVPEGLTNLLKEDIRRISDLSSSFKEVKIDLSCLNPLSQWSESKSNLSALEEKFNNLTRDFLEASQKREELLSLCSINKQTPALDAQGEFEAHVSAPAPALAQSPEKSSLATEGTERVRRVKIKSPIDEPVPSAPTIIEEREIRRTAQPPKPTIRITRKISREMEVQTNAVAAERSSSTSVAQRQPRPELFAHSSFNRPVSSNRSKRRQENAGRATNKRRKTSEDDSSNVDRGQGISTSAASQYLVALASKEFSEEVGRDDMIKPPIDGSQFARDNYGGSLRQNGTNSTMSHQAPTDSASASSSSRALR